MNLDVSLISLAFSHDPQRLSHRWPLGAVPCGTPVTVRLDVAPSVREHVRNAWIEVLDENCSEYQSAVEEAERSHKEQGFLQSHEHSSEGGYWHRIGLNSTDQGFEGTIPTTGAPRVVFYRFHLQTDNDEIFYGRRNDMRTTAGQVYISPAHEPSENLACGFQLTIYDPAFSTPSWFSGSVMYQIFPDRFARGSKGICWEGIKSHEDRNWPIKVHENWDEEPDWHEPYEPIDFFGGTLEGITEHLDYLATLGVEVIYLNPICEARSNHRYNTGDYETIDPILGTWDDFETLAKECQRRGMRLVLDTVLSHTGAASKYFNADNSYHDLGAFQSEHSPYRSWYDFTPMASGAAYRCWWGDPTLPEVKECDPSWQTYMLGSGVRNTDAAGEYNLAEGRESAETYSPEATTDPEQPASEGLAARGVLASWLRRGVSGLRLDVADEIPDSVLETLRSSVKTADPNAIIIGEVWEDATTKESYGSRRTYALGQALDSVMNYPLRDALLSFAFGRTQADELVTFLKLQALNYPAPFYRSLMNLLSSHDVERIRSVLDLGEEIRHYSRDEQVQKIASITESADNKGAQLQKLLATLLYVLPGVPCLYYGDERGLQGGRDPFDRATFPWESHREDCGCDLTTFYQDLGQLRQKHDVLRQGDYAFYAYGNDGVGILRLSDNTNAGPEVLFGVINRSATTKTFAFDLVHETSSLREETRHLLRSAPISPKLLFTSEHYPCDESTCTTSPTAGPAHQSTLTTTSDTCEDGIFCCTLGPQEARVYQLRASLTRPLDSGVGIICHITSIPTPDSTGENSGPGTLGEHARNFVDSLAEAGVRYWQLLPLNPTDGFGSPYAGLSAFAGNTLLLPPELTRDITDIGDIATFEAFKDHNRHWLYPYATFKAIKEVVGEIPWQTWPEPYRRWYEGMERLPELAAAVDNELRQQFIFNQAWQSLRSYANEKGIAIIGDMPIYVSADSADVWAHSQYFALDSEGNVALQGGVPPDQFTTEGQMWGSPTYDWPTLRSCGYSWWIDRFARMFELYDYIRIDHFIGLSGYYGILAGKQANEGFWIPGPGLDLFQQACNKLGPLPIIAEDLGIVTPAVKQLLAQVGVLGMDVIQFTDGDPLTQWSPKPRTICYTGTHDTPTLMGWVKERYIHDEDEASSNAKAHALTSRFIANATASSAPILILPLQDVFSLGNEARMNVPGVAEGNWCWQAKQADLKQHLQHLADICATRPMD